MGDAAAATSTTTTRSGNTAPTAPGAANSWRRARTTQTLNDEQLQHKRSVDRRAQRAFRQRTKDCISDLEQQLAEAHEATARREQHLEALRERNRAILSCLDQISELAREPILDLPVPSRVGAGTDASARSVSDDDDGGSDAVEVAPAPDAQVEVEVEDMDDGDCGANAAPSPLNPEDPYSHPDSEAANDGWQCFGSSSNHDAPLQQTPQLGQTQPHSIHEAAHDPRMDTLSADDMSEMQHLPFTGSDDHSAIRNDTALAYSGNPGSGTYGISESSAMAGAAVLTPAPSVDKDPGPERSYASAASAVLCKHNPPAHPLDQILHDFLNSSRKAIDHGAHPDVAIGPLKPDARALFEPETAGSLDPLSTVMAGVLTTFGHVAMAERLAFFYCMCLTMRWHICPDRKNYYAMPQWLRPTVTQITVPHERWIDNIPWPQVRDLIIENPDRYPFQLFSDFYSSNVTVNWPHDPHDAVADDNTTKTLHSIFEKHICKLKNWTVQPDFVARFPETAQAMGER